MSSVFTISEQELADMMEASMRDVFSTMVKSSIKQHPVDQSKRVSQIIDELFSKDVDLVVTDIGFIGEIFGFVYIFMEEPTAEFLYSKLNTHNEDKSGNEIVYDTAAEFTNIAIGGFKNQLTHWGYPCQLTLPSVIKGRGVSVEAISGCKKQMFQFKTRGKSILAVLIIKEDN